MKFRNWRNTFLQFWQNGSHSTSNPTHGSRQPDRTHHSGSGLCPKPAAILALRTASIPVWFFGRNTLAKVNFQARPHGSIPNTARSFPKTKNPTRHRHQTKPIQNSINSRGRIGANSVFEATKLIAQPDALDGLVPVGTTHCAGTGHSGPGTSAAVPCPLVPGGLR